MEIVENTTLGKKYEENINVTNSSQLTLNGMVVGNVNISDNSTGFIHGMIIGDITILPGARADIHGTVNGTVYNQGGDVAVYGTVGRITTISGNTSIDTKAIIKNG